MRYLVQAFKEPRGEGNGWEMCEDNAQGALFYPCELEEDAPDDAEPIIIADRCKTRKDAEDYLKAYLCYCDENNIEP